ncbi:MFS transporter [Paraferrimonas haliotis]|uniref:MFS transporter n=1 Tax=Paraferrimonas haliotis TaxID=2013866 RepID=UPI000BA9CEB8|nr:MFS transporter [Paraferrimonas haliotis]
MHDSRRNLAILMYQMIALGGIVVDIIVPALPDIQRAMSTNPAHIQWAFAAAMFGFSLGQIVAGFIVDRFGRKTPMVIGAVSLSASLLLAAFTPSIDVLIAIRFIQGLAVSLVAVGGRATIRDIYQGQAYLKAVNWITISFAVGITFSPLIGGYIDNHFGWSAIFVSLALWVAIGSVLMIVFFKETLPVRQSLKWQQVQQTSKQVLLNKAFLTTALLCGIFYSVLPVFNTYSPFLVQKTLGYSAVAYGYLALLLGCSWLLGNVVNRFTLHIPIQRKVIASMTVSILALVIGIDYQVSNGLTLEAFVAPMAVLIFSLGMLFPLFLATGLAPFKHNAGVANAFLFALCWGTTAVFSAVVPLFPHNNPAALMLFFILLLIISIQLSRTTSNAVIA